MQMVDLKSQYLNIKTEVDRAILQVLDHGQFINGPEVKEFQESLQQYLGVKYVIPCANGTDALQIALMAIDAKPGDEVIVPAFTYVATAEVIGLLRLNPIIIDADYDSFLATPDLIEKAITPRTKAIVPVHLYGQSTQMDQIMAIANKHDIFVIEDNAQAIGADFIHPTGEKQKTGTLGHIGCTSFFPSKNLGCYGDGGALMTNDEQLAEKLRMIANHGQKRRYYHEMIGVNSRLDSIQAAVLNIKLKYLDRYCSARRQVAYTYNEAFKDHSLIKTPAEVSFSTHVYHQYTLRILNGKRDALAAYLSQRDIPHMIYYPVPLYEQNAFLEIRGNVDFLPVTDRLCKEVISLPIHTEMKAEDQNKIIDTVLAFFNA
jgi:UDP-2-acetamido-2-deoxy-ribo-hexuluronate aminotransferase